MLKGLFLVLAIISGVVQAQTTLPAARTDPSRTVSRGKFLLTPHPSEPVTTLRQLVEMSDLIIEGAVVQLYPSTQIDPSSPLSLETQARIEVAEILKGSVPDSGRFIRVAQAGGKLDDLEVAFRGVPSFRPGERYVLFLHSDSSTRYRITGLCAGIAIVQGENVRFPESADARLRTTDSLGLQAFKKKVLDIVENKLLPEHRTLLPIHPGPPDRYPAP
jgi:hypothetical protein